MASLSDSLSLFLPKYLSAESEAELYEGIKQFPQDIEHRFYTTQLTETIIYQGDGLISMPVVNLPNPKVSDARVIVISNTCDIDLANRRYFPPRILYCPIINFLKYKHAVQNNFKSEKHLDSHLEAIRKQRITSFFYLPSHGDGAESIALLDRVNHCPIDFIDPSDLAEKRLFVLSNLGFYVLLVKLAIHLTRVREGIDRDRPQEPSR